MQVSVVIGGQLFIKICNAGTLKRVGSPLSKKWRQSRGGARRSLTEVVLLEDIDYVCMLDI